MASRRKRYTASKEPSTRKHPALAKVRSTFKFTCDTCGSTLAECAKTESTQAAGSEQYLYAYQLAGERSYRLASTLGAVRFAAEGVQHKCFLVPKKLPPLVLPRRKGQVRDDAIAAMREAYDRGHTYADIAEEYGIGPDHTGDLVRGHRKKYPVWPVE